MYRNWVSRVKTLALAVRRLDATGREMGLPAAESFAWHGNLFQKLLPQLEQDPFLIVAVTGGTNTGKSVIFNHLAAGRTSRTHPNATQTRHPVCSVPRRFLATHDLADVFPDFEVRTWRSENDPLVEGADNLLFVREDPGGTQPARLLLFDTPDVDGVLKENWRRAELVRHAADVLVCILTQQKYNDAAVREFFQAAAAAAKTVLVVFNMVNWPRQKDVVEGWLKTFCEQTDLDPVHVYVAPWDRGRRGGEPAAVLSADAGRDERRATTWRNCTLTRSRFARSAEACAECSIRARECRLTWRWSSGGRPSIGKRETFYMTDCDCRSTTCRSCRKRLVWDEIWHWLEGRRTRFDRAVNGFYTTVGSMITRWMGRNPQEELIRFQEQEWDKLRLAMTAFLDLIDTLRQGGNEILRDVLDRTPAARDRRGAVR